VDRPNQLSCAAHRTLRRCRSCTRSRGEPGPGDPAGRRGPSNVPVLRPRCGPVHRGRRGPRRLPVDGGGTPPERCGATSRCASAGPPRIQRESHTRARVNHLPDGPSKRRVTRHWRPLTHSWTTDGSTGTTPRQPSMRRPLILARVVTDVTLPAVERGGATMSRRWSLGVATPPMYPASVYQRTIWNRRRGGVRHPERHAPVGRIRTGPLSVRGVGDPWIQVSPPWLISRVTSRCMSARRLRRPAHLLASPACGGTSTSASTSPVPTGGPRPLHGRPGQSRANHPRNALRRSVPIRLQKITQHCCIRAMNRSNCCQYSMVSSDSGPNPEALPWDESTSAPS